MILLKAIIIAEPDFVVNPVITGKLAVPLKDIYESPLLPY